MLENINFNFENANRLNWANEYLFYTISIQLILVVYAIRDEGEVFRTKRHELRDQCYSEIHGLGQLVTEIRQTFPVGPIGLSREETKRSCEEFLSALLSSLEGSAHKLQTNSFTRSLVRDKTLLKALKSYFNFLHKYKDKYSENNLGGILKLDLNSCQIKVDSANKQPVIKELFHDKRIEILINYLKDLVHLCYDFGLKCWWAPTLLFMDDLATWAKPFHSRQTLPATFDGLLGPLFNRDIRTFQIDTGQDTISDIQIPEWALISMSLSQMHTKLGELQYQSTHNRLEQWGYYHNAKWDSKTFNMLFDRIFLKLSIEDIASRYEHEGKEYDPSTVQRNTSELAHLVGIDLPRAPYKKQIQH